MPTQRDWLNSWRGLGVNNNDLLVPVHAQIVDRYNEKHRCYHTLRHLEECFEHWASVRSTTSHPAEVEVALWFHDAIYDTRRNDNEQRSANWAREIALLAAVSMEASQRIFDLIMYTRHAVQQPVGADAQTLIDIDLAILGADSDRFVEYEDQIRREYSWVPDNDFQKARFAILNEFLKREHIYFTSWFRDRYETRARDNIGQSLETLTV